MSSTTIAVPASPTREETGAFVKTMGLIAATAGLFAFGTYTGEAPWDR